MDTPIDLTLSIPTGPPSDPGLDARGLLTEGIARLQALSSADWTDYNLHDPGRTILEVLAFALTDLSYRANHSIEDIIASCCHETGFSPKTQPLFVGPDILTTAPVTRTDVRRFLCDRIPDLSNVWVRPDKTNPGVVEILLQPFWLGLDTNKKDAQSCDVNTSRENKKREICEQTKRLLAGMRPLGTDIGAIHCATPSPYRISAQIELAADTPLESTTAALIEAADLASNPPPARQSPDSLMAEGIAPDKVFDGPRPVHAIIQAKDLAPLTPFPDHAAILAALRAVPGVISVTALTVEGPVQGERVENQIPVIDHSADALAGLSITRNNVALKPDADRVQEILINFVEHRRMRAEQDALATDNSSYNHLHLGKKNRQLSRYRSIQHFFPEIYGLGRFGVGNQIRETPQESAAHAQRRREAEVRQLKAYLLIFEQRLTNFLAQLEHTAPLLSFAPLHQTYFAQSLVHPGPVPDSDDPPRIAPVLGGPEPAPGVQLSPNDPWFQQYQDSIQKLARDTDDVPARRGAAFDHLLARFNTVFPKSGPDYPQDVEAQRKFLARMPDLGANRGLGQNVGLPLCGNNDPQFAPTLPPPLRSGCFEMLERVRLQSGFEGRVHLVEHVLLRNSASLLGIGDMEIDKSFRIRAIDAIRIENSDGSIVLHAVPTALTSELPDMSVQAFVTQMLAMPRRARVLPHGAYRPFLRYHDPAGYGIEVIERFPGHDTAMHVVGRLARAALEEDAVPGLTITRAQVPVDFFASRISVFATKPQPCGDRSKYLMRQFSKQLSAACPAHLALDLYWEDPLAADLVYAEIDWWQSMRSDPSNTTTPEDLAAAALRVKQTIQTAWINAFLTRRKARLGSLTPPLVLESPLT